MTTVDIPVVDEAHARARIDALVCEHALPQPAAVHVQHYDADFLRLCPGIDPVVVHVRVNARIDVVQWAAALGVRAETQHTIHEYEGRRWCAVWTEQAQVPGWLPGIQLSVYHPEDRWIDAPAVTR